MSSSFIYSESPIKDDMSKNDIIDWLNTYRGGQLSGYLDCSKIKMGYNLNLFLMMFGKKYLAKKKTQEKVKL